MEDRIKGINKAVLHSEISNSGKTLLDFPWLLGTKGKHYWSQVTTGTTRRIHLARAVVMTRTKLLPGTWSPGREGARKKYLNFSPLPLASPIGQSQPDVSQPGSSGEAVTVVSLWGKGKVRERWKTDSDLAGREEGELAYILILYDLWKNEFQKNGEFNQNNIIWYWPEIWAYFCWRLENSFSFTFLKFLSQLATL